MTCLALHLATMGKWRYAMVRSNIPRASLLTRRSNKSVSMVSELVHRLPRCANSLGNAARRGCTGEWGTTRFGAPQ